MLWLFDSWAKPQCAKSRNRSKKRKGRTERARIIAFFHASWNHQRHQQDNKNHWLMGLRGLKTRAVTFWFLSQTPMCWVKRRIKGAKNEKEELRGRELWPNSMPSFPWITMVSSSFPLPACDYTLGPNFFPDRIFLQ